MQRPADTPDAEWTQMLLDRKSEAERRMAIHDAELETKS